VQTKLARWASSVLTVVGATLVGAFFLAWVDNTSGLGLAMDGERWLFLVPIAGVALAVSAASNGPFTRIAAIGAGLLVAGDLMLDMLRGMLHGGPELWLMLGGAGVVLAGLGEKNKGLRAAGGIAILVGFFAPWSDESMFRALWSYGGMLADEIGISVRVLWLIPVAGITAIASAALPNGKKLAAFSGIAVFGSLLWMLGSVANLIFSWGAWITLGASGVALVLGVIAPGAKAAKAAVAAPVAKKA
jgi:hypothetical protein